MSILFTKEALSRITQKQITKLVDLDSVFGGESRTYLHDMEVSVDFSLPDGYVSVSIPYLTSVSISPEGELST